MHIYLSGVGGVGIGPLAMVCKDAGYDVSGSDLAASPMTQQLEAMGVDVHIGQSGTEIAAVHAKQPIDWLVISAALRPDHPEIAFAQQHGIRVSKRDEMLNTILHDKQQKLIAVSGTHGKTTTTAMIVWLFKQIGQPISYLIGTSISFGHSGAFDKTSAYFVYEADEFDRNMLHFHPTVSVLPSIDYDHPDVYPTPDDYKAAFRQFIDQAQSVYLWDADRRYLKQAENESIHLADDTRLPTPLAIPGAHYRRNAQLACLVVHDLTSAPLEQLVASMNNFPGTQRRFEKLADNLYTSYTHHPTEIRGDLQLATEVNPHVIAIYQPHQNIRQHEIASEYGDCFDQAEHVYWLPTYLSREDPELPVLTPDQLIGKLHKPEIATPAKLDDKLIQHIREVRKAGKLVLCMGAGDIDSWLRQHIVDITS